MVGEKRTKIVATIGPASSSVSMLARMMQAGMNVCRLNFSHGTHEDHKRLIENIRTASARTGHTVAILQDLQGPKIRFGTFSKPIELKKGKTVKLSSTVHTYEEGGPLPVTYTSFHKDVKKGHRVFMDDGLLEGEVTSVRGRTVSVKVTVGGMLSSHKGINLPDTKISTSSFTKKDHEDLLFGLENDVDWVALSFVTSPTVIKKVRDVVTSTCRKRGCIPPKLITKIERAEAVERFPEILEVSDGIMLARGDLGIEIPFEEVPIVQKEFVEVCRQTGKPIVVATHMLDSMTENVRATRAEVSDVANAVIDHADAVMLSQESAVGQYPSLSVQTMSTVIQEAEHSRLDDIAFYSIHDMPDVGTSVAQSLHVMAENDHIDAIVTATDFHFVAGKINIFRPNVPIIVACPNKATARQLTLRAGIYAVVADSAPATFAMRMERKLRKMKVLKTGHRVAYVMSTAKGEVQVIVR